MGRNRVIGKDNSLIWHLPADLKHLNETTLGKPIIMGRKTFESVGKPLPGRTNIVISRNSDYPAPGCLLATSVEQAVAMISGQPEIFIAGGEEIYKQALPLAEKMYITVIDHVFDGDTFFPDFPVEEWEITEEKKHDADELNRYSMVFLTYERSNK